jgi:hypothetical protein
MNCKERDKVLSYILGELEQKAAVLFQKHVKACSDCRKLIREFQETGQILKNRTLPKVPVELEKKCLREIKKITRSRSKASLFEGVMTRLPLGLKPAMQWALIVIVFCGGVGLGKLLFDTPGWLRIPDRLTPSGSILTSGDENRALHNYLLSVETLFLDLSNMDDPVLLDKEEWSHQMQIARRALNRTRQIKKYTEIGDQPLHQLLTEIEWALEDILTTASIDMAGLTQDFRQTIGESKLLTKIHGFIS